MVGWVDIRINLLSMAMEIRLNMIFLFGMKIPRFEWVVAKKNLSMIAAETKHK